MTKRPPPPPFPQVAYAQLRKICAELPEVVETVSFGHPTFVAGKKAFAVLEPYKGEYAIAFKATLADQMALTLQPRFYVTPYSGKHGWTSLRLDDAVDWDEVRELLRAAYRLVALQRMLRVLDGADAPRVSR